VNADTYQAATLNKLLPPGFKIELVETLHRNYENKLAAQETARRKLALMQNNPKKKPKITNVPPMQPIQTLTKKPVVE
jgi:hypothetical protein